MSDQEREKRLSDPFLEEEKAKNDDALPLEDEKLKNLPTATTRDLQEIFGVTDAELNANRMGRFSDAQRAMLQDNLKEETDGMWLMLTIMLGTAALIALIVFPAGEMTLPMILAIGGVIGAFMAFSYRRQTKAREMQDSQRVKQIAGVPELRLARWRTGEGSLIIGDRRFSISSEQLIKLSRFKLPYMKIYYTQNGERVLSAEALTRYNDDLREDEAAEEVVIIPDDFSEQAKAKH
jgi:hypothetical protein